MVNQQEQKPVRKWTKDMNMEFPEEKIRKTDQMPGLTSNAPNLKLHFAPTLQGFFKSLKCERKKWNYICYGHKMGEDYSSGITGGNMNLQDFVGQSRKQVQDIQ